MALSISRATIKRPVAAWLVIIFCMVGGYWGLNTVGRLEDPSFTLKTALVFVPYPGATAVEVEEEVSDVIENALQQMKQLDRVESKSMPGMAQITVEIEMTYGPNEIPQVWDEMRRRISDVQGDLPTGTRPPIINDDFGDVYGMLDHCEADQEAVDPRRRPQGLPLTGRRPRLLSVSQFQDARLECALDAAPVHSQEAPGARPASDPTSLKAALSSSESCRARRPCSAPPPLRLLRS
jgi:Cu/Ag efflux pump CusA